MVTCRKNSGCRPSFRVKNPPAFGAVPPFFPEEKLLAGNWPPTGLALISSSFDRKCSSGLSARYPRLTYCMAVGQLALAGWALLWSDTIAGGLQFSSPLSKRLTEAALPVGGTCFNWLVVFQRTFVRFLLPPRVRGEQGAFVFRQTILPIQLQMFIFCFFPVAHDPP